MTWTNIGFVAIGIAIALGVLVFLASLKAGWKLALRHVVIYALDVVMILSGFTLAFGIPVQSWFWFIAIFVMGRYTLHVLHQSLYAELAKQGKLDQ